MIDSIVSARLVDSPASHAMYEYVVAGNGLWVRAQDDRMSACIPVAYAHNPGLSDLAPHAYLKAGKIHSAYLRSIYKSALANLPNEAAYQFSVCLADPVPYTVAMPRQVATPTNVDYEDNPEAVVDLHSHGELGAFFSSTDDADEQGLRFYVVVGELTSGLPTIKARVGVYGHHWKIDPLAIFTELYPFSTLEEL